MSNNNNVDDCNSNNETCLLKRIVEISKLVLGGRRVDSCYEYRIYSNSRRGAYLIFRATGVALIRGRPLFKHCTRQIYFFFIFILRYTFYQSIFQWTDTKLIVNLELREKFTR